MAALGASLCGALLLGIRHLAGLQQAASWSALLAAAAALAVGAAVLRLALARLLPAAKWRLYLLAAPSLVLLLGAVSLTSPQASPASLVGLWLAAVVSEWWSWRLAGYSPLSRQSSPVANGQPVPETPPAAAAPAEAPPPLPSPASSPLETAPLDASTLPPDVLQRSQRTREPGREAVTLLMRVGLEAQQRVATLNVAFCPPLPSCPQVMAEVVDGPVGELRVEQTETYGSRLELRLDRPAEGPQEAVVELYAVAVLEDQEKRRRGEEE